MTHEILIFVKILFDFIKKKISLNKANLLNIAKNQEFELITSHHFKNLISPKPAWMEQSVKSNPFEKHKAIASLPIFHPYFRFFLKKRFPRKSSKLGQGNLVLIASNVQVKLSKLNFNFDDYKN